MTNKWIIGISNSAADGIDFEIISGSSDQLKRRLLQLVLRDKSATEEGWDFGTSSIEEIDTVTEGEEYYAYGCYYSFHIDYTGRLLTSISRLQQ